MSDRPALPPEVISLAAAGRRALRADPARASDAAEVGSLVECAFRHGMAAWLPASYVDARRGHTARALDGVRQLVDLAGQFEAADVAAVWFKGPVLSAWIYGDPAARRFCDLDVIVARHDRDRSLALLEHFGYERVIPARAGDVIYAGLGAWPFARAGSIRIDLHWTTAARRFPQVVSSADLLRESVPLRIAGRFVRVPGPTHAAALALSHAAKHLWYALELPFSIAALTKRQDIDWREVNDIMARCGATRAAAAGLRLAAELFDVAIPLPFRAAARDPTADVLCALAYEALALPAGVFPDWRAERRIHHLSVKRARDRIRYDVLRLVEPTRAEWDWLQLPSPLAPLYPSVRLARIAAVGIRRACWRVTETASASRAARRRSRR